MANTIKLGNGTWATKEGSLLAYNDENNNFKPLPFTTTRASSATVVNKQGLIETVGSGIPRIDFSDDANGALLLEPQRTNSLVQSNQFDTSWINSVTTVTSGYLGLDGTNTAWLLSKTANSSANIRQNISFSGIHTFSVYLKKGTNTSAILRSTGGTDASLQIDLSNGSIIGETNTMSILVESMGNNWYRCSMTFNASSNTAVRIYPESPLGGSTAGSIYIQYAQLEQGSYATSYIPTSGTIQTRVMDYASLLNLDTNNLVTDNGSWTVLFELELLSNESPNDKIRLTDASGSPRGYLYRDAIGISGTDWTGGTSIPMNTNNKIIYRANSSQNLTFFKNGVNAATMTSTSTPIVFNRIIFDGSNGVFKIKQMQVFNTTLSDTECINLTTI